jgi:hypothetical protein
MAYGLLAAEARTSPISFIPMPIIFIQLSLNVKETMSGGNL